MGSVPNPGIGLTGLGPREDLCGTSEQEHHNVFSASLLVEVV